jgi:HEPN domain-containing protein
MKQTAVERLGLKLNMLFTDITEEQWNKAEKLFQQAKEMEKQQIGEAYEDGYSDSDNTFELNKEYYNETFNK